MKKPASVVVSVRLAARDVERVDAAVQTSGVARSAIIGAIIADWARSPYALSITRNEPVVVSVPVTTEVRPPVKRRELKPRKDVPAAENIFE